MPQVIVYAENAVTRAGLAAMVAATAVEVVGQVSTWGQLQARLQTQSADLVLLAPSDLTRTVTRGLVQLVTEWPFETSLQVLLLLELGEQLPLFDERSDGAGGAVRKFLPALFATGGVSMLPLTVSTAQVQGAIAAIMSGFVVIHPDVVEIVAANSMPGLAEVVVEPDAPLEPLTPREIEVLNQLAAGLSNKAIASQLAISEHTVKFHISAILSKLDVGSRTEAVAVGIRIGLVML